MPAVAIACFADPQHEATATGFGGAFDPRQDEPDAAGAMRNAAGASSQPIRISTIVPKPLNNPMPIAPTSFATAKPMPSVPAAMTNCVGSISGDAIQNAMTGASGTPAPSRPATSGITPQEQNGSNAPIREATRIMRPWRPVNARAASASAPVARAAAAIATDAASQGAMCASSPAT